MSIDENKLRLQRISEFKDWPISAPQLCAMLSIKRPHIIKAMIATGFDRMAINRKHFDKTIGRERESFCISHTRGIEITKQMTLEIWNWIYQHVEKRAYSPSRSRKIADSPGCSWSPRWTAPVSMNDPLPDEASNLFAEEKRYPGIEIARMLNVSTFRVSRVGIRLGYRGGQYLPQEARHIANCILCESKY